MKRTSFTFLIGLMFIVSACGSGGEESSQILSLAADGEPLNFSLYSMRCNRDSNIYISADRTQIWGSRQLTDCSQEAVIAEPQTLSPAQVRKVEAALNAMTVTEYSGSACTLREAKVNVAAVARDYVELVFAGTRFGQRPSDCLSFHAPTLDTILDVFDAAVTLIE